MNLRLHRRAVAENHAFADAGGADPTPPSRVAAAVARLYVLVHRPLHVGQSSPAVNPQRSHLVWSSDPNG